jgi:hypothetical protein
MGHSNKKNENQNFKPFWSYIDFGKVLKKRKNRNISGNIEFHEIRLDRKRIKSYTLKKKSDIPSLRYIF